ncbi:MAG: urea ABC transporter permease subunit UrtC [Herbaspirillum sp.]
MELMGRKFGAVTIGLLAIVLLVIFPLVFDSYRLNLVGKYTAFAFVALGIVLSWGYGGILSLGQGIFFGMGGYMMAMFLKLEASGNQIPDFMVWTSIEKLPSLWVPFHSLIITIILIIVIPTIVSFIFSYLIFKKRVDGVYFAIVTLALTLTATVLIVGKPGYTGGANGITDFSTLLGLDIVSDSSKRIIYIVEVLILSVLMFVSYSIRCSRYGKILIAIRDNESRVRFSGYNTAYYKAFVFAIAAMFSAIGGAFFSLQAGLISTSDMGVMASVEMVIYAAVGGRLSIPGAVVGAIAIGFLKSYLSESFPEIWLYFLGGIFIFVVLFLPEGFAGLVSQRSRSIKKLGGLL